MRVVLAFVAALGLVSTGSLQAQADGAATNGASPDVELRGVTGTTQLMQIEMENFIVAGETDEVAPWVRQLDDILHQDLDYSDLFWVTRWYRFPGEPAHPTSRALVRGTIERQGSYWRIRGRVEELPGQRLILERDYPFTETDHRRAVHRFADDITVALAGHKGIAQSRIAFVRRNGSDAKELWVVDYDGENLRQLTFDGSLNISPTWSPDGNRVLYTTYANGTPELAVMDLDTERWQILSLGHGLNSSGAWSPDGSRVAFTRARDADSDIWLVNPDGTGGRQLTRDRGIDTSPSWSPAGNQIAFVSDRSGTPQIYVMGPDGTGAHRLTYAGHYNASPSWSPRGTDIAFVSRDGNVQNVYVMSVEDSRMRPVVYARGDCENPTWAPDGRHLVFSSLRGSERMLYILDVESRRERPLTIGAGDCYGPAWSPSLSRD